MSSIPAIRRQSPILDSPTAPRPARLSRRRKPAGGNRAGAGAADLRTIGELADAFFTASDPGDASRIEAELAGVMATHPRTIFALGGAGGLLFRLAESGRIEEVTPIDLNPSN